MNYYDFLEDVKNQLLTIPHIATCKIGIEKNISGDDYPLIRIVSINNTSKEFFFDVYFGLGLDCGDLEALYQNLYDLEEEIQEVLNNKPINNCVCKHLETITDEDKLPSQKMMRASYRIMVL